MGPIEKVFRHGLLPFSLPPVSLSLKNGGTSFDMTTSHPIKPLTLCPSSGFRDTAVSLGAHVYRKRTSHSIASMLVVVLNASDVRLVHKR